MSQLAHHAFGNIDPSPRQALTENKRTVNKIIADRLKKYKPK